MLPIHAEPEAMTTRRRAVAAAGHQGPRIPSGASENSLGPNHSIHCIRSLSRVTRYIVASLWGQLPLIPGESVLTQVRCEEVILD
jgi:hypothetical protein